jgi:hypothetical protein
MMDDDIRAFYQQPWVMVGSDGGTSVIQRGTFQKCWAATSASCTLMPEAIAR